MANESDHINKVFGSYRITAKIASGGFATVYLCEHVILRERQAALKLLHSNHLNAAHKHESFIQEARLLESLKHPSILPLYDVNIASDGTPYIVAEYAPQGSLEDRMKLRAPQLLPLEEVLTILAQIGQALIHAHQHNVIHRDLKPANILFNAKGEALLADFGIATILDATLQVRNEVIGTPSYMAPEQFQGKFGKESDQYALACIAYELVTGQRPTDPQEPTSLWKWFNEHNKNAVIPPTRFNPGLPLHVEQA